jgi:microcystin-dependent protein
MAEPFLGEVRLMSFNFPPRGWAFCNGQLLPINQNQALFSLLGTTFGGDGRVNFALPDLRDRVAVHAGGGRTLGERFGEVAHTLSTAELPAHTHGVNATTTAATTNVPSATVVPAKSVGADVYGPESNLVPMDAQAVAPPPLAQPHENRQPFLVLSFCIALQGIFPSQN